jgi:Arc/MetJ-type ribon-helix-helix transcriptional regulator
MATDGRMTIRLSKKHRATLQRLAKQRAQSASDVVRDAIDKLAEIEVPIRSCYDLLKKTKAIGIMKHGPKDLSTNPKHLEGFGRD